MSHLPMTEDQKARKSAYDRGRKKLNAERKRKRKEAQRAVEEQMKDVRSVERNIKQTQMWWGRP